MDYDVCWEVKFVVNSSNVLFYGNGPVKSESCDIIVGFKYGGVYCYRDCPAEYIHQLDEADSKGVFVAKFLRPRSPESVEKIS